MRHLCTTTACVLALSLSATGYADGLVHQLPADGSWARFAVSGSAAAPDGTEVVSIEGRQTIRSVGSETVDDQSCRWIELESEMAFKRADGRAGNANEFFKLLIPEKYLAKGQNPGGQVLKAYKGSDAQTLRELDLKGQDAREVESLDEIFHAPLERVSPLPAKTIETQQKRYTSEGVAGESKNDSTIFRTETRLSDEVPFGVVAYKCTKERLRNGKSAGARTMEWILVESGSDASSTAPDAN